jgi:hypothetical protein
MAPCSVQTAATTADTLLNCSGGRALQHAHAHGADGPSVKVRVNVQAHFLDQDRNTWNVIAELPGSDPALSGQVVMLGAHLDSWHAGTGAVDNADGVAAVMEAFRILKVMGLQPRRTLRLALWSAEEQGLLGSRAWVTRHLQTAGGAGTAGAAESVSVYFNIDPGKGPIYGWYLENNDAAKSIFDAWMSPFKDLGVLKNVRQGITNTDHLSFIAAGVPGFNPIQDYVGYDTREHHTNADTAERVNEADLKQNAVVWRRSSTTQRCGRTHPVNSEKIGA